MFLFERTSTVRSKFIILPGIAYMNIAEINVLPIRFCACSKFIYEILRVRDKLLEVLNGIGY